MKIISTIRSNKIFRSGLALSFFLLILMIALLISGHFIVAGVVREKSVKVDLSDSVVQKRYNRLMSDFSNLKDERELMKSIRMSKDDVVLLVQYFDEIALKSGVKQMVGVVTVEVGGDKNKNEYNVTTVRYEINVAGGFSAVSNYLTNLRHAPFFLRMESFEIIAPDENSLTGDYLARIFVAVATKE